MSSGITNGNVTGMYAIGATITPAAVATISAVEQTFVLPQIGLKTTDLIIDITPPTDTAGVAATLARVSAANTVAIKFVNPTAGSVTPAAGVWTFLVARVESGTPKSMIGD